MNHDHTRDDTARRGTICLLGLCRTGANPVYQLKTTKQKSMVVNMGRISVILSDDLEKALRFTTIERFGGRKGDLTRAVEDAIATWVDIDE
jgi:hypothetical protein